MFQDGLIPREIQLTRNWLCNTSHCYRWPGCRLGHR